MNLGIGHRTAVEPHVDEVCFAIHGLARRGHKHYVVDIGTVQIDFLVVFGRIIARHESFVGKRIRRHNAGSHSLLYLGIQRGHAVDAHFLRTILSTPYRQRSAPETAAREVPVLQILKPFAEAARACGGRFPLNQTVVLYKFVAHSCGTHKPAVQRIIKHRFVGTPAMRIIVHVLLDAEYLSCHLKLHANLYVERFITGLGIGIIVVLHILTGPARISIDVYHLGNKSRVEILYAIETACKVYHRAQFAVTVDKMQRRHPGSFRHPEVVRTERTCYMHDTCTVFSGHIITGNHAESALAGVDPRKKLAIVHSYQLAPFESGHNLPRHDFVARIVFFKRSIAAFRSENGIGKILCHCHGDFLSRIRIESTCHDIADRRPHGKRRIRRQCPRSGGPCKHARLAPALHRLNRIYKLELGRARGVLYIAIASGLVKLVRAKASTGGRRIRLYGIALIEQVLAIKLRKEPPHTLDITIVVGYVRIGHIDPIAHRVGEGFPLAGILHHLATARRIVFVDRYFLTDILFGNAERTLNAKLHRQSVGVPAGLALHVETFHGFVAAEKVLDGAGHHMVYARHAVCRRRAFVEHERRCALAKSHALGEKPGFAPSFEHFLVKLGKIE